jgi:CMP-N-acetylneuraminic acid synthetase
MKALVIPATLNNFYHLKGDLASFGDTTLLEWKISQCKELGYNIYVSTDSDEIESLCRKIEVKVIKRNSNFPKLIKDTLLNVKEEVVIWVNVTVPFFDSENINKMVKLFEEKKKNIIAVKELKEYVFFKDKKLNFKDFVRRNEIEPVYIINNGAYVDFKENFIKRESLIGDEVIFYKSDFISSIEIKDVKDLEIVREFISIYFKRKLDV